jgi:hypothetical protein
MSADKFFEKVTSEMKTEGIDFKTPEFVEQQLLVQVEEERKNSDEKKKKLLLISQTIESKIKVRVPTITNEQLSLDRAHLLEDMERTMILHSHVIEDIYDFQKALEEMKVVQNSLVCLLHLNIKFRNKLRVKGAKELDTFIASDYTYNEVNMKIKNLQYLTEKSNNYSGLIKQKLNFLREMSQLERAKLYKDGREV